MRKNHKKGNHPNQVFRLNPDEYKDPAGVIVEFFLNYHLKDVREVLWEWLYAGITSSNGHFPTGRDRSNLLFFYENLEKFIEASYIQKRRSERWGKRHHKKAKQHT